MTLFEVRGLVIRTVDVGENDKLLTLITEEKGKITASVRGSRSMKSRYFASAQLCCYSRFVLVRKNDRYYVQESELCENFFAIREDIEKTALASYVCDAVGYVAIEDDSERALFRLALNTIHAIAAGKQSLSQIKAVFEVRAAGILGFMPDVSSCAECGQKNGDFYLDVMNGAILCAECRKREEESRALPVEDYEHAHIICVLSDGARRAMNYVLNCPSDRILSFRLSEEDMRLFTIAAETYFLNQVEHGFATLQFYKDIIRMKKV